MSGYWRFSRQGILILERSFQRDRNRVDTRLIIKVRD